MHSPIHYIIGLIPVDLLNFNTILPCINFNTMGLGYLVYILEFSFKMSKHCLPFLETWSIINNHWSTKTQETFLPKVNNCCPMLVFPQQKVIFDVREKNVGHFHSGLSLLTPWWPSGFPAPWLHWEAHRGGR